MSWNYRVFEKKVKGERFYYIGEAFYNKQDEIFAISSEPVEPIGDTVKELKHDLEMMQEALELPILKYGKITFADAPWDTKKKKKSRNVSECSENEKHE
jgi:hypothetical protein